MLHFSFHQVPGHLCIHRRYLPPRDILRLLSDSFQHLCNVQLSIYYNSKIPGNSREFGQLPVCFSVVEASINTPASASAIYVLFGQFIILSYFRMNFTQYSRTDYFIILAFYVKPGCTTRMEACFFLFRPEFVSLIPIASKALP